jgi:hypothetical protein
MLSHPKLQDAQNSGVFCSIALCIPAYDLVGRGLNYRIIRSPRIRAYETSATGGGIIPAGSIEGFNWIYLRRNFPCPSLESTGGENSSH